ncbi:MAG: hypothetical protein ABIE74_10575 [Pseudomonadota bacterium]
MKRNKWLLTATILLGIMIIPKLSLAQAVNFMNASISNQDKEFILHLEINLDDVLLVERMPNQLSIQIFDAHPDQDGRILIDNEFRIDQDTGKYLKDINLSDVFNASDNRILNIWMDAQVSGGNPYRILATDQRFVTIPYPSTGVRYVDITDECQKACADQCLTNPGCHPDDCVIDQICFDNCIPELCKDIPAPKIVEDTKQEPIAAEKPDEAKTYEEPQSSSEGSQAISETTPQSLGGELDIRQYGGGGKCSLTKGIKFNSDSNLLILLSLIAAVGLLNFRAERQKVKVVAQKKRSVRRTRRVKRKK